MERPIFLGAPDVFVFLSVFVFVYFRYRKERYPSGSRKPNPSIHPSHTALTIELFDIRADERILRGSCCAEQCALGLGVHARPPRPRRRCSRRRLSAGRRLPQPPPPSPSPVGASSPLAPSPLPPAAPPRAYALFLALSCPPRVRRCDSLSLYASVCLQLVGRFTLDANSELKVLLIYHAFCGGRVHLDRPI